MIMTNAGMIRDTFEKYLSKGRKGSNIKRVAGDTWVVKDSNGNLHLKVYDTNVFTLYPDDTSMVTADKWQSNLTERRLQQFAGLYAWFTGQKDKNLVITGRIWKRDGMTPHKYYMVEGKKVSVLGHPFYNGIRFDRDLNPLVFMEEQFLVPDKGSDLQRKRLMRPWFTDIRPFLELGVCEEYSHDRWSEYQGAFRSMCEKIVAEEPFDVHLMSLAMAPFVHEVRSKYRGWRWREDKVVSEEDILNEGRAKLMSRTTEYLRQKLDIRKVVSGVPVTESEPV